MTFDKASKIAEFASYLALILGVPFGLIDFHMRGAEAAVNARKERFEAAEQIYQTVDERYDAFVALCLDHPRLDCYSVSHAGDFVPPLDEKEKIQQKILFTYLTDVFEVAYVEYHQEESTPEIKAIYDSQWSGWDAYIRKFSGRPAYRETWLEIGNEYDEKFAAYMNATILATPKAAR